jgi:hypothetical protein
VAGGDGTISTASAIALDLGLPLLVIPAGTFNYFSTDLDIRSAQKAAVALGTARPSGGRGGRRTPSVRQHLEHRHLRRPRPGQGRERLEDALGKKAAALIALFQLLRRGRPHEPILDGRRGRL